MLTKCLLRSATRGGQGLSLVECRSLSQAQTEKFRGRPTHIIIGAGSAGCVLANRLSENEDNKVLLLEAGPRDHWWNWKIRMPAALMYNLCNDKYNWFYETEPQKMMNNRRIYWPRGRVWGGSSSLNAMVYIRGHPKDYDRWENEGAQGWNYANCLPYFKKAQCHNKAIGPEDPYRGYNGPVKVTEGICENPLHDAFIKSGEQLGIGRTTDINGFRQEGTGRMDMTVHNGERWSTSKAYLSQEVLERPNLIVLSNRLVSRILFEGQKAIGVEVFNKPNFRSRSDFNKSDFMNIYSDDSIILCGGSINSPQLLLLSGVGPTEHLKDINIPVVHHLPGVGSNLQDHLEIYVQQKCRKPITLYNKSSWKFAHNMVRIGLEWFIFRSGLATSSHLESGGFARSKETVEHPDIQFHFLPSTVHNDGRTNGTCHAYQLHVGPMRSRSSGTIRLKSKDPRVHPTLQPNYLSHEDDLTEFRRCIELSRALLAQPAFDEYRADELAPGSHCKTDEQIDAFVREKAASAYHPSCTCRMGRSNDEMAVVDGKTMKVHGIDNLMIVDASAMPSIISGNLNAPVIMMAERAADLIQNKPTLPAANVEIWEPTDKMLNY